MVRLGCPIMGHETIEKFLEKALLFKLSLDRGVQFVYLGLVLFAIGFQFFVQFDNALLIAAKLL